MSIALLYHISSVLLVLFAAGHTLGFRRVDPRWGIDTIIAGLKTTRFEAQGQRRTYWEFFTGFGFFVTVLLLLCAVIAWQLGGLSHDALHAMPLITWGLAACFAGVTYLSWRYFFPAPVVFSALISIGLVLAAWQSR